MGRNELGHYFFIAAFDIITFKVQSFTMISLWNTEMNKFIIVTYWFIEIASHSFYSNSTLTRQQTQTSVFAEEWLICSWCRHFPIHGSLGPHSLLTFLWTTFFPSPLPAIFFSLFLCIVFSLSYHYWGKVKEENEIKGVPCISGPAGSRLGHAWLWSGNTDPHWSRWCYKYWMSSSVTEKRKGQRPKHHELEQMLSHKMRTLTHPPTQQLHRCSFSFSLYSRWK